MNVDSGSGKHARTAGWLVLLTAILGVVAALLGVVAAYQTSRKSTISGQNTVLSSSLGAAKSNAAAVDGALSSAQSVAASLSGANQSLASALDAASGSIAALQTAASESVSSQAAPPSTDAQKLGVDVQSVSSTGNEWGQGNSRRIGSITYDDVVDMGWCSGCLDSSTTSGSIDYDLGGQFKYLDVAIGQLSNSPQSTGTFRFDVELDGVTVKSYTLGLYNPVVISNLPIHNAQRLTFAVHEVGSAVNAYTGFGDPTVHN